MACKKRKYQREKDQESSELLCVKIQHQHQQELPDFMWRSCLFVKFICHEAFICLSWQLARTLCNHLVSGLPFSTHDCSLNYWNFACEKHKYIHTYFYNLICLSISKDGGTLGCSYSWHGILNTLLSALVDGFVSPIKSCLLNVHLQTLYRLLSKGKFEQCRLYLHTDVKLAWI